MADALVLQALGDAWADALDELQGRFQSQWHIRDAISAAWWGRVLKQTQPKGSFERDATGFPYPALVDGYECGFLQRKAS